eukprot:TRINITY_DN22013_c0_g1_i1.p1 TRINITY_DN22013_c0_g1~~TRINITY_DN22013_c0_g1_i1.p1  ORF type:complete len:490 (+),score=89.79 TRINITY_DN22013_c0_g1_i1:28-1470(+)
MFPKQPLKLSLYEEIVVLLKGKTIRKNTGFVKERLPASTRKALLGLADRRGGEVVSETNTKAVKEIVEVYKAVGGHAGVLQGVREWLKMQKETDSRTVLICEEVNAANIKETIERNWRALAAEGVPSRVQCLRVYLQCLLKQFETNMDATWEQSIPRHSLQIIEGFQKGLLTHATRLETAATYLKTCGLLWLRLTNGKTPLPNISAVPTTVLSRAAIANPTDVQHYITVLHCSARLSAKYHLLAYSRVFKNFFRNQVQYEMLPSELSKILAAFHSVRVHVCDSPPAPPAGLIKEVSIALPNDHPLVLLRNAIDNLEEQNQDAVHVVHHTLKILSDGAWYCNVQVPAEGWLWVVARLLQICDGDIELHHAVIAFTYKTLKGVDPAVVPRDSLVALTHSTVSLAPHVGLHPELIRGLLGRMTIPILKNATTTDLLAVYHCLLEHCVTPPEALLGVLRSRAPQAVLADALFGNMQTVAPPLII